LLRKTSDAAESFKVYKSHVEGQHEGSGKGYVIKAVRMDTRAEYTGEAFQRELRRCGIAFQSTVPYTPQEDGISENSNCVLLSTRIRFYNQLVLRRSIGLKQYRQLFN